MPLVEERFYDGVRTREADVAQTAIEFGTGEPGLKRVTLNTWVP